MTKHSIYWILLILFAALVASAQTPTKIDSAKVIQQLQTEIPVYIMCGSDKKNSSRAIFYVKGYQLGGKLFDSRRRALPGYVIVFGIMPRREEEK